MLNRTEVCPHFAGVLIKWNIEIIYCMRLFIFLLDNKEWYTNIENPTSCKIKQYKLDVSCSPLI